MRSRSPETFIGQFLHDKKTDVLNDSLICPSRQFFRFFSGQKRITWGPQHLYWRGHLTKVNTLCFLCLSICVYMFVYVVFIVLCLLLILMLLFALDCIVCVIIVTFICFCCIVSFVCEYKKQLILSRRFSCLHG